MTFALLKITWQTFNEDKAMRLASSIAFATIFSSAYGAAGSVLVGLLWIYYSAIILLLGAEFTKVAAGREATVARSTVRTLSDEPAGVDPRDAGHSLAS